MRKTALSTLGFGSLLVALLQAAPAHSQATRTWVSGVGDDANPCSRTAPCKTFAGAISKTANGGEINCLDPGGFGGVTITKSLTIKCHYTEGGVLVSGTNAIVINATATDTITLKGLDIFGIGTGAPTSLTGIKILSARQVNIIDVEVSRFQAGIAIVPTSAVTSVVIANSHIHDNGIGVINTPGNNTITSTSAVLRNNNIQHNTCGVVTSALGANASTPNAAIDCGTAAPGAVDKPATTSAFHNGVNFNSSIGMLARGANGTIELFDNEITGSVGASSFGLRRLDGGIMRSFLAGAAATNVVSGNTNSNAVNASAPLQ